MPFLNLDNNYSNLAQFYNQSFVNRPSIPTKAEQFLPFDDGFIRGGITNATLASTKDVIRIGKFITGLSNISKITDIKATTLQTATKGILFLSKQVGLQRTNPRLEWDRSNPLPPLLGGATRQFTGVGMLESVGGNALRAAVLGANDGLVSNMSLVMGVAGAAVSNNTILLTGCSGLLAGAISMALGEWLSVQSSKELYENQIALETAELEASPEEEKIELILL